MNFRIGKEFKNREMVEKNLKKVSDIIHFNYQNIIRPDYNHTNKVGVIKEKSPLLYEKDIPSLTGKYFKNTDGLLTSEIEIALMSTNADCNLILIYDPVKKVIGNIHAGWRGTFEKIVKNAIIKIKEEYNSNPEDIICCFCPSIRKCHFEVDEDVKEECKRIFESTKEIDEIIYKGDIKEGKQKYYIDTILINKILLKEEGILEKNIIDSEICSMCNSDEIHSRRAEGLNFGLGAALIERKLYQNKK